MKNFNIFTIFIYLCIFNIHYEYVKIIFMKKSTGIFLISVVLISVIFVDGCRKATRIRFFHSVQESKG